MHVQGPHATARAAMMMGLHNSHGIVAVWQRLRGSGVTGENAGQIRKRGWELVKVLAKARAAACGCTHAADALTT